MMTRIACVACVVCSLRCGPALAAETNYATAVANAIQAGEIAKAKQLCDQWVGAEPDNEQPRLILGRALLKSGTIDQALEQFELAAEVNPLSPVPHYEVGLLFMAAERLDRAASEFGEALRVDADYLPAMLGRVKIKLLKDDAEAALADAERVVDSHPDSASAHAMVSDCLFALGEAEEALVASRRAFELEPRNADVLFGLARACQTIGEEAESQQHWRRFLEAEPSGKRADRVRNGWIVLHTREAAEGQGWQGRGVTWSPDGRRLAFMTSQRTLDVLPLGKPQAGLREIATTATSFLSPRWSPDGRYIAMLESVGVHLWAASITPADGSQPPRQLLRAWGTAWPPLEEGVLYCNAVEPSGAFRRIALDGTPIDGRAKPGEFRDAQGASWGLGQPDFSPDGQRVVFVGYRPAGIQSRRLFVFSADDWSKRTQLTGGDQWTVAPDFSPDGRSIAYLSQVGGRSDLWVVAADGSAGPALLVALGVEFPFEPAPEWSPDGREIAYGTRRGITVARVGGLDRSPVSISAKQDGRKLTVAFRGHAEKSVTFDATYEIFGPKSIRIARGPVGDKGMQISPGEVVECDVDLDAPEEPGDCVVKVTAVTAEGARSIKLVRLPLPG